MQARSHWLVVFVLGLPLLAVAQVASGESASADSIVIPPIPNAFLSVGASILLFKAFSQRPRMERWLVGALLSLLFLVAWDRGDMLGVVVAGLLAAAWCWLKAKTGWLDAPPQPAQSAEPARSMQSRAGLLYRAGRWLAKAIAPSRATARPTRPDDSEPRAGLKEAVTPQAIATPADLETALAAAPPAVQPASTASASIFVSYRRQDSADVTGRIYDRLVQRFDRKQIFKDVDSIPLGVDFRVHLGDVVGRCNLLLAVIGPQWLAAAGPNGRRLDDSSDFVRIEIEAALARNIPVIPLLVGGADLPAEGELPPSLAALTFRNGIAVRADPDFHRDMDRLIAGLESHQRA